MCKTITLPDGYRGHTIECYVEPIYDETNGAVKLQVAEKGKEYMFKWVYKDQYNRLKNECQKKVINIQ